MPNPETYREKAVKCVRAGDETHTLRERAELFGLASVYMALADCVDADMSTAHSRGQGLIAGFVAARRP
jgi:hypothetical protein